MKTNYLIATIMSLILMVSFGSTAQNTAGGGIAFGTEIENIGIHANGQFFIKENIAISPSIVYYFPKKIVDGFNFKWFEINANANYYFTQDTNVNIYGLAGLNFSFVSVPIYDFTSLFTGGSETSNATSTYVGLNLGIGADFPLSGNITPFGQLRYNISSFDQLAIEAGVRFQL